MNKITSAGFIAILTMIGLTSCNQNIEEPEVNSNLLNTEQPTTTDSETNQMTAEKDLAAYKGKWFNIDYPKEFSASPTSPSKVYNGETIIETDEARFASSDGAIEFFVFSPQWNGNPIDYLTIDDTEELVDEKTENGKSDYGDRITHSATIKAKDGSYSRLYLSIKDQVGTGDELHHVFGIKYKDEAYYEKYKKAYEDFKDSLKQLAD